LSTAHKICSSVEQILSTDEQICLTANKIRSAAGQVLSTHEQTLLDAHKICPAIEKILSMAEQIFLAGHPFWPAADQIFNPNQREIACPKTTARLCWVSLATPTRVLSKPQAMPSPAGLSFMIEDEKSFESYLRRSHGIHKGKHGRNERGFLSLADPGMMGKE